MMQQEPFPTNAAVLARVQQLAAESGFYNPFVIGADHKPLWNAPELERVIKGEDNAAPTLSNLLRKVAKIVRDDAANFVRSGPRVPSPSEIDTRKKAIVAQADLLDQFAGSGLAAIVRDQVAIENVFAKFRELGTRAPDAIVSGFAFAVSVFDRYPLIQEDGIISEDGKDFVLHYKGYEGRFPKIPMFSNKWTINLSSNDRRLFTKIGGNAVIDGRTREEVIANAKRHVDELG